MTPIVFWASLVPWPRLTSADDTSCSRRNSRSTGAGVARRKIQYIASMSANPSRRPISGDSTMNSRVLLMPARALVWAGINKTLLFIVLSPLIGLLLGFALMLAMYWIFRRATPAPVDRLFRRLQLVSSALVSLGHGTNDAQKTMGVIAALLFANGYLGSTFYVPAWVVLTANATIAAGTLAGGWRIVKTMGMRITKLE